MSNLNGFFCFGYFRWELIYFYLFYIEFNSFFNADHCWNSVFFRFCLLLRVSSFWCPHDEASHEQRNGKKYQTHANIIMPLIIVHNQKYTRKKKQMNEILQFSSKIEINYNVKIEKKNSSRNIIPCDVIKHFYI